MTERRIYAACLASYNNGCLHGRWIDADQDADTIMAEINAMLKASPCPNVTRQHYLCDACGHGWTRDVSPYTAVPACCPECSHTTLVHGTPYASAEEFAIHDHEGFDGLLGEYSPIDEVVQVAEALEEHGEKYAGLRKDGRDHDEALRMIEENYQGCYDSLEDWAEQLLDDTGAFSGAPEMLKSYFDFERYARDCELSGDIMTIEGDGRTVHVFWNH
jgi:antirestriction protein